MKNDKNLKKAYEVAVAQNVHIGLEPELKEKFVFSTMMDYAQRKHLQFNEDETKSYIEERFSLENEAIKDFTYQTKIMY